MWVFNTIFSKIFDLLFLPFRAMSPWIGMLLISFLVGLLMLVIYRYTSNQEGIKRTKDKIKAHLLEIRLFSDSLSVTMKAQGNILLANLKYMGYAFKPLLIMIIPLVLILIQMNFWFGYNSLSPEEPFLVKIELEKEYNPMEVDIKLEAPPALTVETLPLRIAEDNEINWRLSAKENGTHDLIIMFAGQRITKKVTVAGKPLSKLSPKRLKGNVFEILMNPAEAPITESTPIKSVEISYPEKQMSVLGFTIPSLSLFGSLVPSWLIVFFVLSIIFGFAFKGIMGVEI